jgi:hypothetical protein
VVCQIQTRSKHLFGFFELAGFTQGRAKPDRAALLIIASASSALP